MALRVSFTTLIILSSFLSQAQVQLALFGGAQATSAKYTVTDIKQPTDFKYGAMAGAGLKVFFENRFFFFPAIYYSQKGYKVTLNNPAFPPTKKAKNNNTTLHTVEIAPLFQLDFSYNPSHFFVRFGPAIDFAFSGKETFDTVSNTGAVGTLSRDMKFAFTEYGRFTASGNIHLGYQTKNGLMVFAHYAHGIGNLNNADEGPSILHRVVGLSVGWLFGRNPNVIDTRNKQ